MKAKLNFMAFVCMIAMLAATTFTSCNKDDDEGGSSDPKDLIGTWKVVSEEWWEKDSDGDSDHDIEKYDDESKEWSLFTFKDDGTWYCYSYGTAKEKGFYHDSGTYTISGNKLVVMQHYSGSANATGSTSIDNFDYTKLTWTDTTIQNDVKNHNYFDDSDDDDCVTFSVSGSTLTITYEETDDGDWYKEVHTFKKQ